MTREEALEVMWENLPSDKSLPVYEALQTLIPELRESDDDRIRKSLVEYFSKFNPSDMWDDNFSFSQILAYLEKQKYDRMKPVYDARESFESALEKAWNDYHNGYENVDKLEDDYVECAHAKGFREGYLFGIEKQKEQKPSIFPPGLGEVRWNPISPSSVKQKPAEMSNEEIELSDFESELFSAFSDGWQQYLHGEEVDVAQWAKEHSAQLLNAAKQELKPAEWIEDYREEDIQTRFAFYTYKDDPSVLYLSNVFVEETSRNHGFGTRILKAAEKAAEAIGAITICLKVKQDSPANAWYRKRGYGYVVFEDGYDWLEKNLEYMKPYKQEWSEDDEDMRDTIIRDLKRLGGDIVNVKPAYKAEIDWLKSLRPQPHWKPSKRQMNILKAVKEYVGRGGGYWGEVLRSLIEDLEKLM